MEQEITFKQFLKVFNFRATRVSYDGEEIFDTTIIRIYPKGEADSSDWFEFGLYAFGGEVAEKASSYLSSDIVNSTISSISYNSETDIINVYLSERIETKKVGVK